MIWVWSIVAVVLFGIGGAGNKVAFDRLGTYNGLWWVHVWYLLVVVGWPLYRPAGTTIVFDKKGMLVTFIAFAVSSTAHWAYYKAMELKPGPTMMLVISSAPLISVATLWIYGDAVSWKTIVGAVLICVGLTFLA